MSIPLTTFREWTLSAFIIQSALAVSQSGVQRTLQIDNIFREAEYYSLLKNEGNKVCIPRCPFQVSLPGWCSGWCRGEGRAGVLWGSHWVSLHSKMQQLQHLPAAGTTLCPALSWVAAWLPISSCPGTGGQCLIISEAHGSQTLGLP